MANLYLIRWGNRLGETHTRGSVITWQPQLVTYRNPQQSPGGTIHIWSSQPRFREINYVPALPLLIPEAQYQFQLKMTLQPAKSVNLVISYYDGDNSLIRQDHFATVDGQFTYPADATSYRIELINLNNQELKFEGLWLAPVGLTYTETLLNNGNKMIMVVSEANFDWSVTIVAESLTTTSLPLVAGYSNAWIILNNNLAADDIRIIRDKLKSAKKLQVKTFGPKAQLKDAQNQLETQLRRK